jgi:hypothetical protein
VAPACRADRSESLHTPPASSESPHPCQRIVAASPGTAGHCTTAPHRAAPQKGAHDRPPSRSSMTDRPTTCGRDRTTQTGQTRRPYPDKRLIRHADSPRIRCLAAPSAILGASRTGQRAAYGESHPSGEDNS